MGKGESPGRIAVALSFWVGGVGLSVLKGIAYAATGSAMVRTSMFDSFGDVVSSAIMAVTQWQMSNAKDAHRYPVGKARFAPLGVLFFCAFMCSSMCSMTFDSVQQLVAPKEEDAAAEAASAAVRRLLEDHPRAFGRGRSVESLAAEYSAGAGDAGEAGDAWFSAMLMFACLVVKLCLYVYCRLVARKEASEIVRALADDHRNDIVTNSLVIGTMAVAAWAERQGHQGVFFDKLDPAVSTLLSLWIMYGWITNALDQVKALSDRRADGEDVDVEAVRQAACASLEGLPLECRGADAYHAGDGVRVRVDIRPAAGSLGDREERMAQALAKLRGAVSAAADGTSVLSVEACLRSRNDDSTFAWVKEYPNGASRLGGGAPVPGH